MASIKCYINKTNENIFSQLSYFKLAYKQASKDGLSIDILSYLPNPCQI